MTFKEIIGKAKNGDGKLFYREAWRPGTYLKIGHGKTEMYEHYQLVDTRYFLPVAEMLCDDWTFEREYDDEYDYGVSAYVTETEAGMYAGFILINTDEYDCPKGAIESLVAFSEEYELGFDRSDIDLKDVLGEFHK